MNELHMYIILIIYLIMVEALRILSFQWVILGCAIIVDVVYEC